MLDERTRRIMRLRDNLVAYATILKNSGLPAEEAVELLEALAGRELSDAAAEELGIRTVLDAYYSALSGRTAPGT